MLSVEVDGPQVSSDGKAATRSAIEPIFVFLVSSRLFFRGRVGGDGGGVRCRSLLAKCLWVWLVSDSATATFAYSTHVMSTSLVNLGVTFSAPRLVLRIPATRD